MIVYLLFNYFFKIQKQIIVQTGVLFKFLILLIVNFNAFIVQLFLKYSALSDSVFITLRF